MVTNFHCVQWIRWILQNTKIWISVKLRSCLLSYPLSVTWWYSRKTSAVTWEVTWSNQLIFLTKFIEFSENNFGNSQLVLPIRALFWRRISCVLQIIFSSKCNEAFLKSIIHSLSTHTMHANKFKYMQNEQYINTLLWKYFITTLPIFYFFGLITTMYNLHILILVFLCKE